MIQDPRHPTYYKVYIDSITLGTEPIELESDVLETEVSNGSMEAKLVGNVESPLSP